MVDLCVSGVKDMVAELLYLYLDEGAGTFYDYEEIFDFLCGGGEREKIKVFQKFVEKGSDGNIKPLSTNGGDEACFSFPESVLMDFLKSIDMEHTFEVFKDEYRERDDPLVAFFDENEMPEFEDFVFDIAYKAVKDGANWKG